MQIIDELEKDKRGPYAGCVGYFSADGQMDTCIVLRTALVKDGIMHVQAGAGLVYDSVPENEQQECINKAKALVRAAEEAVRFAAKSRAPVGGRQRRTVGLIDRCSRSSCSATPNRAGTTPPLDDRERPLARRGTKDAPRHRRRSWPTQSAARPRAVLRRRAYARDADAAAAGVGAARARRSATMWALSRRAARHPLSALAKLGNGPRHVMVIGHNPGLHELALELVRSRQQQGSGSAGREIPDLRARRHRLRNRAMGRPAARPRHAPLARDAQALAFVLTAPCRTPIVRSDRPRTARAPHAAPDR